MRYIVVMRSECQPDDHVSFDGWSFAEACGIAAALTAGAVKEATDKESSLVGVCFAQPDDYRFVRGYGIKRVESSS